MRYARFVDNGQWESFADLFTENAVVEHPAFPEVLVGHPAIVAAISASLSNLTVTHVVGQPDIEFGTDTAAHGVWTAIVQTQRHDGDEHWVSDGLTEYHAQYQQDFDGRWRISWFRAQPITRVAHRLTDNTVTA